MSIKSSSVLLPREQEMLQLVAEGLTNAEIADKLFPGKRTIEPYRRGIIEKIRVKTTATLVKTAACKGWLA